MIENNDYTYYIECPICGEINSILHNETIDVNDKIPDCVDKEKYAAEHPYQCVCGARFKEEPDEQRVKFGIYHKLMMLKDAMANLGNLMEKVQAYNCRLERFKTYSRDVSEVVFALEAKDFVRFVDANELDFHATRSGAEAKLVVCFGKVQFFTLLDLSGNQEIDFIYDRHIKDLEIVEDFLRP